jgi:hypothetical protein
VEVEHLGRAATNICLGQIERLIQHLLKHEYSPAEAPRRQWQLSVHDARRELHRQLTPTIRRVVETELPELSSRSRDTYHIHVSPYPSLHPAKQRRGSVGRLYRPETWVTAVRGHG